jgi:hypothetical protein
MSKDEFLAIIDSSYDNGTPLWIYTDDYIYGMVPKGGDRWMEVTYDFSMDQEPLIKAEKGADLAFQLMFEEVSKGVAFYIDDLNVQNLKDFAKTIEGKSGSEKIKAIIDELINNTVKYSSKFPIIKSKNELGTLKSKL